MSPASPAWWSSTVVISGVVSLCVSIAVSFLVALLIGPWQAGREEAARRDRTARWEVARGLKNLRRQAVQERRRREQRIRQESQVVRKDPLTIYRIEHGIWPAVALLDDPTISEKVRGRVRAMLVVLLGEERLQFLESLSEAPKANVPLGDISTRMVESRALDDLNARLVDRLAQNDDIPSVQAVIHALDDIIRVLS